MTSQALEKSIRDIAAPMNYITLGEVVGSMDSSDFGRVIYVRCDDTSSIVECRPIILGVGLGYGTSYSFEIGTEVVVLFPGGDRNSSLCISGPTNRLQQPPSRDEGVVSTTSPGGSDIRRTSSPSSLPVATSATTQALSTSLDAVVALLQGQSNTNAIFTAAVNTIGIIANPQTEALRLATLALVQGYQNTLTAALGVLQPLALQMSTALASRGGDPFVSNDLKAGVGFTTAGTPIPPPVVTPGNGKEADKPPPPGVQPVFKLKVLRSIPRGVGALAASLESLYSNFTSEALNNTDIKYLAIDPFTFGGDLNLGVDRFHLILSSTGTLDSTFRYVTITKNKSIYALDGNKEVIGIFDQNGNFNRGTGGRIYEVLGDIK
jgi:hypothetical protein